MPQVLAYAGCNYDFESKPELKGVCCATSMMAAQQDFREQKGQLQEELEGAGQKVIFYPKFHCELNFTKHYWCSCKWYAREPCEYSLQGLQKSVPAALDSVTATTINCHYHRSLYASLRCIYVRP